MEPKAFTIAEHEASARAEAPGLPPSIFLYGNVGTGKTFCLSTLAASGLKIAYLYTEPRGLDSLVDGLKAKGALGALHARYVAPTAPPWSSLIKSAEVIARASYEDLTKMKHGIEKAAYGTMVDLLKVLADFRTDGGQSIGPVDELDSGWAFVLDSLSGLNIIAMDLVVGSKPVRHQGEWGVAMELEERLINTLCSKLKCFFVLTAHPDREVDEISGGTTILPGALGRKLSPRLPRFFSDVIWTYVEGGGFFWSTSSASIVTKGRSLPISTKLQPTFVQIVDTWRKRYDIKPTI